MPETIGNNPDIQKKEIVKDDNLTYIPQEIANKLEGISTQQRINETFWDLEWHKYKEWDVIKFMYMWEDWEKKDCSFNINNQTIEYEGITYKVDMPKWANLDSIEFKNWEINIRWSIWWFTWKWKTTYTELYNALGQTFNNGYVEIATGNWNSLKISKN